MEQTQIEQTNRQIYTKIIYEGTLKYRTKNDIGFF